MARIKLNLPNLPRGADVEIPFLGVFKNGSTRQVDEEQVENWRWQNAKAVEVGDRPEGGVAAVEYQRGPTLKQAFENHEHIEVLDDEPQKSEPKSEKKMEEPAPSASEPAKDAAAEEPKKSS